jgi:tRNA pseudouridine32 synthase/23S rRNA pseudouridine746 synthase
MEDHFDALRFGLPRAPALAHRLDRDTSGCLILGRHRKALAQLGQLFRNGAVGKTYWAIVEGVPASDEGVIALPLGRLDVARGWWMKHDPNGRPAVTKWKVMGKDAGMSWLALEPLTGRTHQLRVHCAEMGWPIMGDAIYGNAPRSGGPTLHLHAREIVVPLYKNRVPIRVVAPAPPHMWDALAARGWNGEEIILPRETGEGDRPQDGGEGIGHE